MSYLIEVQLISIVISLACCICGSFLVLRKMSMTTDAISHTVILGIVLAFFITNNLNSPLLIIGASIIGVLTVWLIETIKKTKKVNEDSSIAVVYPFLFSIAVILISLYAKNVHLDTGSVFLGELVFTPFNRINIFGIDIGPAALYVGLIVLILNIIFILIFYKQLKLSTFDPLLATFIGFSPTIIHYLFVTIVSITAVGSFEVVGSVLVVSFMIVPPSTAYLITNKLKNMILLSVVFTIISNLIGFQIAYILDVSISGMIAFVSGIIFFIVFCFAPKKGLISLLIKKINKRKEFTEMIFLYHIKNHQNEIDYIEENGIKTINNHIKLNNKTFKNTFNSLLKKKKIVINDNVIHITKYGIEFLNTKINKNFN